MALLVSLSVEPAGDERNACIASPDGRSAKSPGCWVTVDRRSKVRDEGRWISRGQRLLPVLIRG
jgi:hypothetical protein